MKKIIKQAFAITDWGGGMKHPSVSIFDTKKEALEELEYLNKLPDPSSGESNKLIRVLIKEI